MMFQNVIPSSRSRGLFLFSLTLTLGLFAATQVPAEAGAPKRGGPAELSWAEALERFRKLSPAERLRLVEKAGLGELATAKVVRGILNLEIVERGSLEAASGSTIVCSVKAGARFSTIATTVKWVIDEGTFVRKGDKVLELDDSGLQDQFKDQEAKILIAKADLIKTEGDYQIQEGQNESDIEAARIARDLAKLNLEKYLEGDYRQAQRDVDGRIYTATAAHALQEDRLALAERMLKDGKKPKSEVNKEKFRLDVLQIALSRVQEEKRVLEKYTKVLTELDLRERKKQADRALERAKLDARARLLQFADIKTGRKVLYELEKKRGQELQEEIRLCVVHAPNPGLVIYVIPEQSRFGGGNQGIVAQGEPVREGQRLLQITDLSRMQVITRVPEALVSHLRSEDPQGGRAPQGAQIRVDAFPARALAGHVKKVATVPEQKDFLTSDVKVYRVVVSIDDALPGLLRPGMSAAVRITPQLTDKAVLQVPLSSVLTLGKKRLCFVLAEGGLQERVVALGVSNDKVVEIKAELKEGEQVVTSPRFLVRRLAPLLEKVERPGGGQGQARGPVPMPIVVRSIKPVDDEGARRSFVASYGLTYQDLKRIAALPSVVEAVPVRSFPQEVRRLHRSGAAQVVATTAAYAEHKRLRLVEGRFLSEQDDAHSRNVAVLGAEIAEHLFPGEEALGATIVLAKHLYVVVGVLEEQDQGTRGATAAEANNSIYLPLRTCQARFGDKVLIRRGGSRSAEAVALHSILVTVRQTADVSATVEEIRDLLEQAHMRNDWSVEGPPD